MKAILTQLAIQFRSDFRDKGVLMVYYLVPLVFYVVMGGIMKTLSMESGGLLALSLTIFTVSMSSFLGIPAMLVKARELGYLEAYRAAGIPAWSLPFVTIVMSTLHIMIVATVIMFSAPLIFRVELPRNIAAHLLTILLAALCSQSLGALIACLVKKQNTMTLAAQCLFLPSIMFSGIMFPAELLPKPMRWIGEVLPATQGVRLYSDAGLQIQPLLILIGVMVVAFAISAVLFRRISVRK
jgi:ABC-2 type transport system permease protein